MQPHESHSRTASVMQLTLVHKRIGADDKSPTEKIFEKRSMRSKSRNLMQNKNNIADFAVKPA